MIRFLSVACLLVLHLTCSATALAGVFGDGNPDNGVEDSRVVWTEWSGDNATWGAGSGVVFCDGAVRGSATILDVLDQWNQPVGQFIVTAAHVFIDLETHKNFEACRFDLLALGELQGYSSPISPEWVTAGKFDSRSNRTGSRFGESDWAFAWLPSPGTALGRAKGLPLQVMQELPVPGGAFWLLAYDSEREQMAISGPCQAVPSTMADLGGGGWPGHFLDDCDSLHGSSGGSLVRQSAQGLNLVGIRSGSHWSAEDWPPDRFPEGPPPGVAWNSGSNTNYFRAVDPILVGALERLILQVRQSLETR